ncbi:haloacid dehalogenase type II [Salinicoccus hispanicus]|uniref:Haloacid dehalogenase type II n=1 Tax=Salinicoccus hispanicus TaxID=157225 RepID=A0A6N8TZQ3_9STAP|nr:haloacid dehalogenase type II [Salinicoccus hispanicus]MXQ51304.1 haloacid dehalogenase type II [Salinicoccus hispanicus]
MIKALVFDAYGTLYDVHSVKAACESVFPDKGEKISAIWREKQVKYFFQRQLMGGYRPFDEVTRDALRYACRTEGVDLETEDEERLMMAYLNLELFEEVADVLEKCSDKQRVVFSNGSESMIVPLVESSDIHTHIDRIISADEIKQYKPTPAAYAYALDQLGLKRDEVLFMSSNTWDIMGASSFGFQTAWINRNKDQPETLDVQPDQAYTDLYGILELL